MLIGFVAALEEEIKPLIEAIEDAQASKWGKRSLYQGGVGNCQVVVMACGVGKVKAAACTQHLIDLFAVDAVICCGTAGAVNPQLRTGDIVVAKRTLQHDLDLGDPDWTKKLRKRWLRADPKFVELAMQSGRSLGFEGRVHRGTVLTGDQAILSQEKRQWLWENFRGDCVEMEGAAVAQVCQLNNKPFLIVRAISDSATEEAVTEFKRGLTETATDAAKVVLGVLERI